MKYVRSCMLLLAWFMSATMAYAQLHNLDIRVVLSKNGDAHITETRQMTINSEGTECYIKIDNVGKSIVKDFVVSDEQAKEFMACNVWDVDWSREMKTGKSGIVMTATGYELCWGIGAEGKRTYTATYTLTNLIEGYSESDGFNWMFVARDIKPYPEHVKLTMTTDDGTLLNDSIARIWAFGYGGDINFVDNTIVAETTEPFKEHDAMIVMCEFKKGVFSPVSTNNGSFEKVKEAAFEGSDYLMDEEEGKKEEWWVKPLEYIGGGIMIFLALCGLLWEPVARLVNKFKYKRNIDWYRDIPLGGDLENANHLMNELQQTYDYDKLLSASVLKLVQIGALGIESHPKRPAFVVNPWEPDTEMPNKELLHSIYSIFQAAAGNNQMLDSNELTNYMNDEQNESAVFRFLGVLHKVNISSLSDNKTEVRNMLGLKKYLEDFTLLDERGVQEVTLWKDYMVWATLFGCASTVVKQMAKINPEYFKMDDIARQIAHSVTVPQVIKEFTRVTGAAYSRKLNLTESADGGHRRRSGGGGHASRGGGGGHRGGGSGGGIR